MKRITWMIPLLLLLLVVSIAGNAGAAQRWQDRDFTEGCTRVFRVVPANSTMYSALVDKYGADWVFQAATATTNTTLVTVLGNAVSGQGDCVLIYPGTYTLAAPVNVTKNVTIMGTNANDVTISVLSATSATIGPLGAFTVTSAAGTFATSTAGMTVTYATAGPSGSGAKFRNFTLELNNVTAANGANADGISIPGTNVSGVVIDGVRFVGAAALTGTGHIAVDAEKSDKLTVTNCNFVDTWIGVAAEGNDVEVSGNVFTGTRAAATAIALNADQTASEGLRGNVRGNRINLTGASAQGFQSTTVAAGTMVTENWIYAADPINITGAGYTGLLIGGNLGSSLATGYNNVTN